MFIKMPDTLQFRPLLQETNRTNDLFQSEPSRPCCRITALPPRPINRFFVVAFRRLPLISAIDIAATHVAANQSTLLLLETKDCA